MVAALLFCVYFDPEQVFSSQYIVEDAQSNSPQDLYQDIVSTFCGVILGD